MDLLLVVIPSLSVQPTPTTHMLGTGSVGTCSKALGDGDVEDGAASMVTMRAGKL